MSPSKKKEVVMKEKKLLLDVYDRPPALKWLIFSLQHVFAMFGATILVPMLVNAGAGEEVLSIPVTLFTSGLGTLIYIICTKGKSPVYLGSSFAFITPMIVGFASAGKAGVFTAIVVVGLIYVLFAVLIKFIGKEWINKLLPPIIIGPMIMIIGLSLAPSALQQIGLLENQEFIWQNAVVALITFSVTVGINVYAKGFLKVIPFLVGIVTGYIASIFLGMVDFTLISETNMFIMPKFIIPFRDYALSGGALFAIVPVVIVTIAEHIGDHKALSVIMDRDLIEDPGLDKTLLGDGLATAAAGLLGGPSNTTYGENTAVVGMTKVASAYVVGGAAVIAIAFAFLGKLAALFESIPPAVLGGVSILLYGFIASNGLKVLVQNQVDFDKERNVVIASTMLVLGLGGATLSILIGNISISLSGMALAALIGIFLNLILPES